MSKDIECPNCKHDQEICHDDGYGYAEGEMHTQFCTSCDYEFKFTTYTSFTYEAYCAKTEDHKMEQSTVNKDFYICSKCEFCELREDTK